MGRSGWTGCLAPVEVSVFGRALGHRQVTDAYLVREAERHRGRLATFDRRIAVHAAKASTLVVLGLGG